MRKAIFLLAVFPLLVFFSETAESQQKELNSVCFAFPIDEAIRLRTQSISLPTDLTRNSFEFFYKDAEKPKAVFPVTKLKEFKDEFELAKLLSGKIPFSYDPAAVKVYVVFSAERITPGGLLLKLHSKPTAATIDKQVDKLCYLPTKYQTPDQAKKKGELVDFLTQHFDKKKYTEIKSWAKR